MPKVEFIQLDATKMTFHEHYDYIGAFDVLEHIIEDEKVIQNVNNSLKICRKFLLIVPQYMFMWSIEMRLLVTNEDILKLKC